MYGQVPVHWKLLEVDVKDMFPSIAKDKLIDALMWLMEQFLKIKIVSPRKQLFLSVHKNFRALDRLGISFVFGFLVLHMDTSA